LKLELDLIDQLMGADFDETVAQGNPDNVTKKVVDNSHDNVADENLNCFKI
jgi:hypothetical protein